MRPSSFFDDFERAPTRIAWTYAGVGGAWILISDSLAAFAMDTPVSHMWMDLIKGWLFIAATAGLVFLLVRRAVNRELAVRRDVVAAQERFQSAATQFPFTLAIFDAEQRMVFLNTRGLQLADMTLGEVVGRRIEEVFPLPLANACRPALDRALEIRRVQSEVLDVPLGGGRSHLAATATPLLDANGAVRELHLVLNDLTSVVQVERRVRRINRSLQAISAANSVLVHSTSEAELLQAFCQTLVDRTGHRLVWVGLVTPGDPAVHRAAHAGVAGGYLDGIEIRCDDTPQGRGPSGLAIRTGQPQACHDFTTDERMAPWRERAARHGLRSSIALPLRSPDGVLGAFTLYSGEPNRFDDEEVKLLMELANDLAYGLVALRRKEELARSLTRLRESEERLQTLKLVIEQSSAIAYVTRAEPGWPVEFVSANLVRVFGYRPEDLVSGRVVVPEVVHPDDLPDVVAKTDRAMADGLSEFAAEYRLFDASGKIRWVRDVCTLERDATGLTTHLRGVITDVTEQHLAMEELAAKSAFLTAQVECSPDGVLVVDSQGRKLLQNQRFNELWQIPPTLVADPDDRKQLEFATSRTRDPAQFGAKVAHLYAHPEETSQDEVELVDGTVLERHSAPVRGRDGHYYGRIWTFRDVTERVQAAAKLRQNQERLAGERALLRALLDSIPDLIFFKDQHSVYRGCNRAFEVYSGLPEEDLIGKSDLDLAPPEMAEIYRQNDRETLASGQPQRNEEWIPFKQGGGGLFETLKTPYYSPDGELLGLIGISRDITQRKQTETQIRWLASFPERNPNLIAEVDLAAGRLEYANPVTRRTFPTLEAELLNHPWLADLPGMAAQLSTDGALNREITVDGTTFRQTFQYLPDARRVRVYGTDISDRKQAEAQVRDALAYLGTLIDASPVGLISYDATGQAQTANEAAALIVGARVEQLLAQNFHRIECWKASGMLAAAERAAANQRPERIEAHFVSTFGKEVWVSAQFVPFQRGQDRHLLLMLSDIGDRGRAMTQLRLQSAALEAAANAIIITDAHGVIEWVNDAFTRSTGYAREEVIGKNPRVLKSGKHQREFYESLWQTIRAGDVWHGEIHNMRKNGTPLEEDATITPVKDTTGKITHFIAIKQDVTERKSLEKQLLRAQRMEGIGLLAGGIAHDLNNVLAPILMGADLLKLTAHDEQTVHQLDGIVQSAKRGADIVKQVLTFARGIEGERIPIHPKHVIKEMARMARETFPRNLQFHVDIPTDLWPVLGDPTQLHQVLLNLSVNARDAMPDGGTLSYGARNAEVDAALAQANPGAKPGPHVVLRVQDTGTGIPPAVMERIFEPFFTTKELGKGTGLGLSTVIGIVRSHGGFVTVESEVGRGTAFEVWLPANPQAGPVAKAAEAEPVPAGHGELVLVVDDEASILTVTRAMLEGHGYRVLTAGDGTLALTELSQHLAEVRLVITDILMPFMDGVQLIHALRRMAPELKIIASSGALGMPGQKDRTDEVKALGVKHILHKPYPVEQFLRVVHDELHPHASA